MAISKSVGEKGINLSADVKLIQAALNDNLLRLGMETRKCYPPLTVTGKADAATIQYIREFQQYIVKQKNPDGRVDPGGTTLRELNKGVVGTLSLDKLKAIMPTADDGVVQRYYQPILAGTLFYQIVTPLRLAHFLAQIGHESLDLRYSEEIADGSQYEGRADLGNTEPGDGKRFKGRGLIQLTGRNNYKAYGEYKKQDFLTEPNNRLIATDAYLAVDVACWFWFRHNLNQLADSDNVKAITKIINGGYNGLEDRKHRVRRAKFLLVAQA